MPAGTPVEQTAAVLHELGAHLATVPEVTDYQAYAGTAAPINFNGLVRQYYLRAGGEVGDIQVNLVDKHHRSEQSHAIAMRVRPGAAADRPPLRREREGRRSAAGTAGAGAHRRRDLRPRGARAAATSPKRCARCSTRPRAWSMSTTAASPTRRRRCCSSTAARPRCSACRRKSIVSTLRAGLAGEATSYLHDESKYPAAATLQLPAEQQGDLDTLLQLGVRTGRGQAGADPRAGHRQRLPCASSRSTTRTCCR